MNNLESLDDISPTKDAPAARGCLILMGLFIVIPIVGFWISVLVKIFS